MSDHEERIRVLEETKRELEDGFLMMTHLETKQGNVIRQQAQAIDEIRRQSEEQRQLNRESDKRIADLVSAVGKLISIQHQ